jgi:hypothetical protein
MAEVPANQGPAESAAPPAGEISIVDRISAAMSAEDNPDSGPPPDGPLGLESAADAIEALDAPPPEVSADAQPPADAQDQAEPGADVSADAGDDAADVGESAPAEDGESEVEEYSTLAEFAEKQGYDPEDLYELPIGYTLDGKPGEFTLGEYKDRVKDLVKLDEARNEFNESKSAWESQTQATRQQVDEHLHAADALLKNIAQEMMSAYNQTNWDELRQDDPQEWSARRQEFAERSQLLQRAVQYGKQIAAGHREVGANLSGAELGEVRQRETAAMIAKRPSWAAEDVRKAEGQQAAEYLEANGFSVDEIENTTDHRLVLMALKAREFDQLESKANVVKKRVKKIARRTATPGRARDAAEVHGEQVAATVAEHRRTGSVNSAAEAIRLLG